ncbi:H-type lectin domain-containing protein [Streptomyces tsukubensis]|uniref:H-type lectin domain-containing protein n=1 Tax=Streptomyces tsukubensis TaxID=83656 RepID=UPI00344D1FEB
MPLYDKFDQKIPRPALSDAPNIETAMRDLLNGVVAQTVLIFEQAADRAATMSGASAPVVGTLTFLRDSKRYELWDGTTWKRVVPQSASGTTNVSFTNRDDHVVSVTFPQAFSSVPRVFVNISSSAGVTGRWSVRAYDETVSGFKLFLYAWQPGNFATWSGVPITWHAVL